jgi:photosystem II stability/assembly factor-like uncharacterized protein
MAVPAILTHPRDADWVLIRVAFERVYLSFDGGMSFAPRWDGMTLQTEVISLALDPDAPDLVFAGATDALFRSTDGALHWQRVPGALDGQTVFVMVRSPSEGSTWLAGTTQGVYRSGDSGLSWVRTGLGAKDVTVTALAIDPSLPTRIYAGTKTDGVFASLDGGRSWVGIGPGSPALNVAALQLSLDGRWLLAATSAGVMKARVR